MLMVESQHPNVPNIVGGLGCLTEDAKRCNLCCFEPPPPEIGKCKHMTPEGCDLHGSSDQPETCREFHCSKGMSVLADPMITDPVVRRAITNKLLWFLEMGVSSALISEKQAEKFANQIQSLNYVYQFPSEE